VPKVREDLPLVDGDPSGGKENGVLTLLRRSWGVVGKGNGGVVGKSRVEGVGRAKLVEGSGDRASIGAGEIGGIRMDSQDHVGSPIDLATMTFGLAETKLRRRLE
jgi:hypothetical protein